MYIINYSLLVLSIIYIYSYLNFFSKANKSTENNLFILYSMVSVLVLVTIKDVYYFYLIYKLLNICIYMILITMSINPINFRYILYYYFIRFITSLLFIISLYDLTNNSLSTLLMNISVLIKLRVYPFSDVISNVYKHMSFKSYLVLNYIINYLYLVVLFCINSLSSRPVNTVFVNIVLMSSLFTLFYASYSFTKQYELKGTVAYSSISNLPIVMSTFSLISSIQDFSRSNFVLLITYISFYLVVYTNNILILNLYSFFLEPIKGKT